MWDWIRKHVTLEEEIDHRSISDHDALRNPSRSLSVTMSVTATDAASKIAERNVGALPRSP